MKVDSGRLTLSTLGARLGLVALLAVAFCASASSSALAATADEVALLPTLDPLNRTETPLSNGGKWAALNWSGGTQKTGKDTTTGWGPYDAYPTVNGAYWSPLSSSEDRKSVVSGKSVARLV